MCSTTHPNGKIRKKVKSLKGRTSYIHLNLAIFASFSWEHILIIALFDRIYVEELYSNGFISIPMSSAGVSTPKRRQK